MENNEKDIENITPDESLFADETENQDEISEKTDEIIEEEQTLAQKLEMQDEFAFLDDAQENQDSYTQETIEDFKEEENLSKINDFDETQSIDTPESNEPIEATSDYPLETTNETFIENSSKEPFEESLEDNEEAQDLINKLFVVE